MTTPETPSETPGTAPRNDRRRWRRAYLLGAGSVLAVELVVAALVAAFVLHPPVSVAGTAGPAQPAP
ncbi:MAG: class F sortase, partial [Saccharomonospora viridis]